MKPPRNYILWYLSGVDQRILHESVYPGTAALRLSALAYVGTPDHEVFEVGELTLPRGDGIDRYLSKDEFVPNAEPGELADAIEGLLIEGLFREVPRAVLEDRGLVGPGLPPRVLVLDREHLTELSQVFGSVRNRLDEALA